MKIAVLDDYQDMFRSVPGFERLKGHEVVVFRDRNRGPGELVRRLQDADIVVLTQQRSPIPRSVVEKLPRLRLIAQTGSHRDHFDIAACSERGIAIAAKPGAARLNSTAELTWGLIIASYRHIPEEAQRLKQGAWQTTVGNSLYGKTLGIYALGKIGAMVAKVGAAFGMKVTCWGREGSLDRARVAGYEVPASREAFFGGADIVSLHIPLDEQTRGIVTAADLARMKPGALLVNTSRAQLIEEGALAEALRRGRPGRAAVDVYESEPVVDGDHPLFKLSNALCTPHLGYNVRELYEVLYGQAIENILAFISGDPVNVLNPEALSIRRQLSERSI
ncbi:MAG: D-2-hydroxyacid dehydrogenase family protein [Betaproteobacteria bacterium]|nr:D-2-hydroxyacid dehydrogenase family protein [Betaproteobacteria bacterium]